MHFQPRCIFCGNKLSSPDYCCTCNNKDHLRQYRTIDVEIDSGRFKTEATSSFENYSFKNEAGMLQYKLLPNHDIKYDITTGLTPLHYLSDFSSSGRHIFMKDEGQNPSACFKDRESVMCLLNSKTGNAVKAVIYSSGNAAASAAVMTEDTSCQLISFVPGDTYPEKIEYIQNHGSDVIVIGDENTTFEQGYRLFADINAAGIFAAHGFDNWSVINPFRVQGDKTIAVEIVKQLSARADTAVVPDYVIVPTANGSCLAGIWKGFKELYETGITEKLPEMVSVGMKSANPVNKAVHQNKTKEPVRCDLTKADSSNSKLGSIIRAEEGYDSMQAASAVVESNGFTVELNNTDIQHALIHFLEKEGALALKHSILPEPASLTSLAALKRITNVTSPSKEKIFISISTGHGLKASQKIEKMLSGKPKLQIIAKIIISNRNEEMKTASAQKGTKFLAEPDINSVLEAFFEAENYFDHAGLVQPV